MRPADIVDLMKGLAIDVREYIAQAISPIAAKQAELEERVAALAIEKGEPGPSAFQLACAAGFAGSEAEWLESLRGPAGESVKGEPGSDGASVTVDDIAPLLREELAKQLAEIPPPQDGKNVTIEEVRKALPTADDLRPVVRELVDAAAAAIPVPANGKDGRDGESVTLDDVRPLVDQAVADAMLIVKEAAVEDMRPLLADDLDAFTAALSRKFEAASCYAG
jgi:hypothetical protein